MGPVLASCADGCIPELMCIGTGLVSAGNSPVVQLISPLHMDMSDGEARRDFLKAG